MLRVVFLTVVFVASSVLAKQYTFFKIQDEEFPDACDGKCAENLKTEAEKIKQMVSSMKKIVIKDLGLCSECHLSGFHDFAVPDVTCMVDKDNGLIDHSFQMKFSNLAYKCNCNLNTLPSKLAAQFNGIVDGEYSCGIKDPAIYTDMQCTDDGTTSDAVIPVTFQGNLNDAILKLTLRANTVTKVVFPVMAEAEFTAEYTATEDIGDDTGKFAKSLECMKQNDQQFTAHISKRVFSDFFPCMTGKTGGNTFDRIIYKAASCQM